MAKNDVVETMDLTMEGEPFDELRRNFNIIIQRLIKNMSDTESDEAKISITVDVTSSMTFKDEESGVRNTEMELVWDDEQHMYVLKPVMGAEQMNINDYMKQQAEQQSEKEQKQDAIETDPEKKWMNVQQIGVLWQTREPCREK